MKEIIEVIPHLETDQYRFVGSINSIRNLSKKLSDYADEAEGLLSAK